MDIRLTLGAALAALSLASAARADPAINLLVNGGLEMAPSYAVNQFNMLYVSPANNAALPGWTITSGTVDLLPGGATGHPYWQNTEGNYSLDMVGTPGAGSMYQSVPTTPGVNYTLTFDFAANPEEGPYYESSLNKYLVVQAIGNTTTEADFSAAVGTRTKADMQYGQQSFTFSADSDSTILRFTAVAPPVLPAGLTASMLYTGPVLDNLVLVPSGGSNPTPEPASLSLLALAAAPLLLQRRRKV